MNKFLKPVLVIFILAVYYFVTNRLFGYVCPSEILIGLPCPACGLTRAALLLLKGDVPGSLRMNPMLLFIPAYFVLIFLKKKDAADNYLIILVIVSFLVFGWRMLHSFGTEPLVYNPNNIVSLIIQMLHL